MEQLKLFKENLPLHLKTKKKFPKRTFSQPCVGEIAFQAILKKRNIPKGIIPMRSFQW